MINEKNYHVRSGTQLTNNITLFDPTIDEILEFGKEKYWSIVLTLTTTASDHKKSLQDAGIDYKEVSDFEMFCLIYKYFTPDLTELLFGKLDFTKLLPAENTITNEFVLWNPDSDIVIDEATYLLIVNHIKKMHGLEKYDYIENPDDPRLTPFLSNIQKWKALKISAFTNFIRCGVLQIGTP